MVDPITLQVIQARLAGIVQEMQNSLFRTGYSTIIRESQDASCAILNRQGEVVAQHVVLPLHMGAFPACAEAISKTYAPAEIQEGDAYITNHPYLGGSPHAPDMGVFTPIFFRGEWVGFTANMAHKSDIGGTVPGSGSGSAREIYQEGLHLPPIKLMSRLRAIQEIEAMIAANSRTPGVVIGDLRGQVGAARLGERRIAELMERYGKQTILDCTAVLSSNTEKRVRQAIETWPDGESQGESFVDHDGIDLTRPIRIHVKVKKTGDRIHFDFSGSSDQTQGPANIRPPLVRAACVYCLVALVDRFLPINQGLTRVLETTFRRQCRRSPLPRIGEHLHADRVDGGRSRSSGAGGIRSRKAHFGRIGKRRAGARRARCSDPAVLRTLRDLERRHRSALEQRRRVGNRISPEQLQDRTCRNHRIGVSHPRRAI
jgi:N-methylhydantoinase B